MPASQFGGSANRVRRQVTGTMSTGPIPTFFDGTYHPEAAAGSRKPKAQLHPAPAWRYLYNSALLVLDAAMMLIACGLVFLISGNVLSIRCSRRFPEAFHGPWWCCAWCGC